MLQGIIDSDMRSRREGGGGLDGEQNWGVLGQGAGDEDSLPFAPADLRELSPCQIGCIGGFEGVSGDFLVGGGLKAESVVVGCSGHQHRLDNGKATRRYEFLSNDGDFPGEHRCRKGPDALAVDGYGAGLGLERSREQIEQRGLSAAVWACDGDK